MPDFFTHGYALLVGVGADLPVTVADAQAMYHVLVDPSRAAYPQEQVILLTEQNATRQRILDAFDTLIARVNADPEATAIVYFSGHGGELVQAHQPTQYYLVPYGYDPAHSADTTVTGTEFTDKIEALKAKKLVVLLDCCHAAGMPAAKAADVTFTKGAAPPTLLPVLQSGSGSAVIASSRSDQYSYIANPNSIFTLCLLEAFAGKAALEADGYVRVLDVIRYLFAQVPKRAAGPQNPFVNKIGGLSENFALCYYAAGAKARPDLPATVVQPVVYSGWERYKLEARRKLLLPTYDLLNKKIAFLQKDLVIEAGSAVKFQLEQQLLDEQARLAQMEKELDEINNALQPMGS